MGNLPSGGNRMLSDSHDKFLLQTVCSRHCCRESGQQQEAVDIVILPNEAGQMSHLDNNGGIVAVPNEMRRDKSSNNLQEYGQRMNSSDSMAIVDKSNFYDDLSKSVKFDDQQTSIAEVSTLKSQLAKTRRENKRLMGELRALRSAYAQIQADRTHWKTQAGLILKRAQIFETQLKNGEAITIETVKSLYGGLSDKITGSSTNSLPGLAASPSSSKLNLGSKLASSSSLLSVNQPLVRKSGSEPSLQTSDGFDDRSGIEEFCFGFPTITRNAFIFVIEFSNRSNSKVADYFRAKSEVVAFLRQQLGYSGLGITFFAANITQFKTNLDSDVLNESIAIFESISYHPKLCLWLVRQQDLLPFEVFQSSLSTPHICVTYQEKLEDPSKPFSFNLSLSDIDSIIASNSTEKQLKRKNLLPRILTSLGQVTYAGFLIKRALVSCEILPISYDFASNSYYLSRLHLALNESASRSTRSPVFVTSSDPVRLLELMNSWIAALSNQRDASKNISYFTVAQALSTDLPGGLGVVHALYQLTMKLIQRIELPPLLRYPSTSSFEKLLSQFYHYLNAVAANIGGDCRIVVIIYAADGSDVDLKSSFAKLIKLFAKPIPHNFRVFIFANSGVDDIDGEDDEVDTASEISSQCSSESGIAGTVIKILPLDKTEISIAAKSLIKKTDVSLDASCIESLGNRLDIWLDDVPDSSLSWTLLNISASFMCHMKTEHGNLHASMAYYSINECLLAVLRHVLEHHVVSSNDTAMLSQLVAFLISANGDLSVEDIFLLMPLITIDLFSNWINLMTSLGLISYGNKTGQDSSIIQRNQEIPSHIQLRYRKEIVEIVEQGSLCDYALSTVAVSACRRKLVHFYSERLSSQRYFSSDDVSMLLSLFADWRRKKMPGDVESEFEKIESCLLSSPVAMHLLYHSGDIFRLRALTRSSKDYKDGSNMAAVITSANLVECQKALLLENASLAPDVSRAHVMLSLAGIAADNLSTNLAISLAAEAVEITRSDRSDSSLSSWTTLMYCHLLLASIATEAACEAKTDVVSTVNRYRTIAERNLSQASKLVTRRSFNDKSSKNEEDDELWPYATELFSAHIAAANMRIKESVNKKKPTV